MKTSLKDWPCEWLPDMDLNHDKQIQSLLCYRYTIGQTGACKLIGPVLQSRRIQRFNGSRARLIAATGAPVSDPARSKVPRQQAGSETGAPVVVSSNSWRVTGCTQACLVIRSGTYSGGNFWNEIMATSPIRVAVTGAAGQIGYALIFRIASGAMFGPSQPVILHLIEIEPVL